MSKLHELSEFSFQWSTLHHEDHPQGDLLWHLICGIIVGASILWAIISHDFLFLVIGILGLIFFFHPFFSEAENLSIGLTKEGIKINDRTYTWSEFDGFEFYHNGDREFLFLNPHSPLRFGFHVPLEEYVSRDELRIVLRQFLREYSGSVPVIDRWFRSIFR